MVGGHPFHTVTPAVADELRRDGHQAEVHFGVAFGCAGSLVQQTHSSSFQHSGTLFVPLHSCPGALILPSFTSGFPHSGSAGDRSQMFALINSVQGSVSGIIIVVLQNVDM